ncbi:rhodanese-like domain-containing protein [Photobacterium nomapromontoriensis]|uniref:rhodanese-like domain-containing protein n=1 Tax=Photobacterium nomapromontoriensis TaxID=2910237 RepID=UPI003D0D1440
MQKLLAAAIICCTTYSGLATAEVVTPKQFWHQHQQTQQGKALIVDVRTNQEFIDGHLPNAINIPHDDIEQLEKIAPDKTQPIFIYCRSGHRASIAEQALKKQGYENIFNGESYQALLNAIPISYR